jgi:hypothetical protein
LVTGDGLRGRGFGCSSPDETQALLSEADHIAVMIVGLSRGLDQRSHCYLHSEIYCLDTEI